MAQICNGSKAHSQLVSLELCETVDIWPVLFQLQALTHLRLSVVEAPTSSAEMLPVDRELPNLRVLILEDCTASISPLFDGTSLPQLVSLSISDCQLSGSGEFSMPSLDLLEELTISSVKQAQPMKVNP